MAFWNRKSKRKNKAQVGINDKTFLDWLGIDSNTNKKSISQVTYFTCLKLLAETMGKLPLHFYQQTDRGRIRAQSTDVTKLLTVRPNPYMTPSTLWTVTEFNCQHFGNAFIYIQSEFNAQKYGGEYRVTGLYPMQPDCVTVWMDDVGIFGNNAGGLYYEYRDPRTGKDYLFPSYEVLHFKTWFSKDGIMGEPVREILKDTITGANDAQDVVNKLYEQGMTASMVMQYTGDLDDQKLRALQKKFASKLTGPQSAGKVIPIPAGLTLQPLNMKFTDSQFYELKKYSALQIAGAFGIKPNQINDYDKSSYSNSETQNIAFLTDTMLARLKMYEEEINSKLLTPEEIKNNYYYKFNEKVLLRTDSKTQMDALTEAVNNAIYKPNEARELLDLPAVEGGDVLMCNGNYIPITQVGKQYNSGGDSNGNG